MKNRRLKYFILVLVILGISIGFAVISTILSINGLFTFPTNTWNIYLDKVVVDQEGTTTNLPTINSDNDSLTFTSTLNKPGDYYSFNVDVVNNSTIDAMLGEIKVEGITSEYSDYLACDVTYSNGTTPNTNDILYKTARVTFNVRLYYKDITNEQIPTTVLTPTINITINYKQANSNAVLVADTNHWNFDYTGNTQTFTPIKSGSYKIEAWGASGTLSCGYYPGLGSYTSGIINNLNNDVDLYIYVGLTAKCNGGTLIFNGGGGGESSGGGATDVRLVSGNWNDFDSLKSRIMVAGAGGGGFLKNYLSNFQKGSGGGFIGYNAYALYENPDKKYTTSEVEYGFSGFGGTQFFGGAVGGLQSSRDKAAATFDSYSGGQYFYTLSGGFGFGGYGSTRNINSGGSSSGGGSGYFGGGWGMHPGNTWTGGGGGSSFISGHAGCVAIDESSTEDNIVFKTDSNGVACNSDTSITYNSLGYNTDQKCSIHYSTKVFSDTVMIDGEGYQWTTEKGNKVIGMPNKNGMGMVTGNSGNGFARISLIS